MGSITTAQYTGDDNPKTNIKISGIGLKADPDVTDVELTQSVLGSGHPDIVTGFGAFECDVYAPSYGSNQPNVKLRMKDEGDHWTDFVQVST